MLYTIVIVACFSTATIPAGVLTDCRTYEQPATELSMLPTVAYIQAQTLVAQWGAKHPTRKVKSFTLLPGRGA